MIPQYVLIARLERELHAVDIWTNEWQIHHPDDQAFAKVSEYLGSAQAIVEQLREAVK